jgi:hypothetical protein
MITPIEPVNRIGEPIKNWKHENNMRNYELIKAIYDRCPDMAKYPKEYSIDQIFDRTQDIINMIERERPELAKAKEGPKGHLANQKFFEDRYDTGVY